MSELSSLRQALYTLICRYPSAISPFPTHKARALALCFLESRGIDITIRAGNLRVALCDVIVL
jgi:hypothetical protein